MANRDGLELLFFMKNFEKMIVFQPQRTTIVQYRVLSWM